jgi:hypothetical protein
MTAQGYLTLFSVFLRREDSGYRAECPTTKSCGKGPGIDEALVDLGGVKALYLERPDPGEDFYVALCADRSAWRRMIKEKSKSL